MADIKKLNGYFLKDEQARGSIAGHIADDTKHVTASEKAGWDGKYQKPGTGIPKGDLAESVKGSLDKADSALQEHQSLAAYRTATAQDVIDGDMQEQIDALASRADVVDVVGTRAELAEYDTSLLTQDDVIKVLEDETKDDAIAYYRWVITAGSGAWTFVGTQGPFYTKSETDQLVGAKYTKPGTGIPKTDLADGVIPTKLSELTGDTTHRTVTDAEKTAWDGMLPTASVSHETWTFTLGDDTTVDKEVVLWTSET